VDWRKPLNETDRPQKEGNDRTKILVDLVNSPFSVMVFDGERILLKEHRRMLDMAVCGNYPFLFLLVLLLLLVVVVVLARSIL
jgi:hypothetical protein